jgi:hypothetical protein
MELLGRHTPPLLQWFTAQGPEPKEKERNNLYHASTRIYVLLNQSTDWVEPNVINT